MKQNIIFVIIVIQKGWQIFGRGSLDLIHMRVISPVIVAVAGVACSIRGATKRRDRLGRPILIHEHIITALD